MSENIRKMVFAAVLTALVIILQLLGGIPIGPVSITLTLVPIVIGALLLGPAWGAALGLIFGVVVSILSITGKDPGGQMVFAANPAIAWVLCLLKGAAAGFLPAVIFRAFSGKKAAPWVLVALSGAFIFISGYAVSGMFAESGVVANVIACAVCAALAAGYLMIIKHALSNEEYAPYYLASMIAPIANTGIFVAGMLIFFRSTLEAWAGGTDMLLFLLTGIIGVNFIIEFAVSIILAPAIAVVVRAVSKRAGNDRSA